MIDINKEKAIVLLSGGQDSTTCLFWAINKFGKENVLAIGFDYGQKHKQELTEAKYVCEELLNVQYRIIDIKGTLGGSSLINHNESTADKHKLREDLPSSFTPGRNALFLTIAGGIAFNEQIGNIVCGACETDYSGYPDCRQEFIKSQQKTLRLALEFDIKIHTPLMSMNKAQTWKLAKELGEKLEINTINIIKKHTLTDYNGDLTENEWGYGKLDNPASEIRARGYFEAKEKGWI